MTDRIYITSHVKELEALFDSESNSLESLIALQFELGFRKTKRAKTLLEAVNAAISATSNKESAVKGLLPSDVKSVPIKPSCDEPEAAIERREFAIENIDWTDEISKESRLSIDRNAVDSESKPISNEPNDIIDTWTALEALTPQSYRQAKDLIVGTGSVAHFGSGPLPWEVGEKSQPRKKLFYMVYLGSVDLKKTSEDLLQLYRDDREELSGVSGQSALGVIVLDKKGVPLGDNTLAISSYGWAYGRAMSNGLDQLKHWDLAEEKLKEGLLKLLVKEDEDGNTLPLDSVQIRQASQWLAANCTLPNRLITPPSFAIRLFQPFGRTQPEPPLLNSFYLKDLQRAKSLLEQNRSGAALNSYLGLTTANEQCDLLNDFEKLSNVLEPKNMSLGRWPVKGRFPLVLLQQAALNIGRSCLKEGGLFSVNGPPGTGKTTLLRDVVASVIIDRAEAMSAYEIPERAFHKRGTMNARGKINLYEMDSSLKGHEILVASSNNKAVENISKELPLADAIDEDVDLNYFKPLCDSLLAEGETSWGLIATVLGNAKNKGAFVNNAWWEYDTSFHRYFTFLNGTLELQEDHNGEPIIPSIVSQCDPPESSAQALENWRGAREKFNLALKKAKMIQVIAQDGLDAKRALEGIQGAIETLTQNLFDTQSEFNEIKIKVERAEKEASLEGQKHQLKERAVIQHQAIKPSWISRIFAWSKFREWKIEYASLSELEIEQRNLSSSAMEKLLDLQSQSLSIEHKLADISDKKERLLADQERAIEKVTKSEKICGDRLVTANFLAKSHKDLQTSSPVFTDVAHRIRDDLFISAIRLHKAFIDAAATPIRQNLAAFMSVLGNKRLPRDSASLLGDVWSTGFLVSPVFSTAFASIDRMLGQLPSQSIGWLLIDEAGQASPQQAVGAIMRAKRVMAVGDPLQIEPIVTTPKPLIEGISSYLGVDHFEWVGPESSVQSLADRANKFGAWIDQGLRPLWIGSPLLVHRRCEEPMFSISNQLAYNGKMVKATVDQPTKVANIFGSKASWFDIRGNGQDKWCAEEGEFVVQRILEAASQVRPDLDLFVITPFRIVAQRMRDRLRQEAGRLSQYGIKDTKSWIDNNVGTVHTFQGKEAETVIFLLGAPNSNQHGARNWAASSVNLLNVAVSRAKRNFYIVGNQSLWAQVGQMPLLMREINKVSNPVVTK